MLNIWQEIILKGIEALRSVFLPGAEIVFQLYRWLYHLLPLMAMGVLGVLELGSTTSCSRVEDFPMSLASQGFINHPGLIVTPHRTCTGPVQQPSYLLGPSYLLLFRAGQNNATVFPSPSPTLQRVFKRTKDVGHHSLQEESPVETLIWVNVTFELKPCYMSKFKIQFNTIFRDQTMVEFQGLGP